MHVTTGYIDVNISTNLEIRQQQNCVQFTLRVSTVFTYRRIEPVMLRGAKPPILGQGEARRTEAIRGSNGRRMGFWRRSLATGSRRPQQAPPVGSGAEPRPRKGFIAFQTHQMAWNLLGHSSGDPLVPLNPPAMSQDVSSEFRQISPAAKGGNTSISDIVFFLC